MHTPWAQSTLWRPSNFLGHNWFSSSKLFIYKLSWVYRRLRQWSSSKWGTAGLGCRPCGSLSIDWGRSGLHKRNYLWSLPSFGWRASFQMLTYPSSCTRRLVHNLWDISSADLLCLRCCRDFPHKCCLALSHCIPDRVHGISPKVW